MDLLSALPNFGGNWVDLLIVVVLLFFFIEGVTDRFIPSFFNLIGFLITYAFALKFYTLGSHFFINNFSLPHGIANALGFFAVAMIVEFIYNVLISLLYRRIPVTIKESFFNRTFGFIPSTGNGIMLIAFILTLFISLPTAPN